MPWESEAYSEAGKVAESGISILRFYRLYPFEPASEPGLGWFLIFSHQSSRPLSWFHQWLMSLSALSHPGWSHFHLGLTSQSVMAIVADPLNDFPSLSSGETEDIQPSPARASSPSSVSRFFLAEKYCNLSTQSTTCHITHLFEILWYDLTMVMWL